jgi:hypothetical protein
VKYDHVTNASFSRLVFDRETGKPRGYGFCEFAGTSLFCRFPADNARPFSDSESIFVHPSPQPSAIEHRTQTSILYRNNLPPVYDTQLASQNATLRKRMFQLIVCSIACASTS